ncbi:hypothetical protein F5888DRAFT_1677645 [Russula emetica]|nr:hypothetical protein F5888DRAFT_1677645 [Russula emetica]
MGQFTVYHTPQTYLQCWNSSFLFFFFFSSVASAGNYFNKLTTSTRPIDTFATEMSDVFVSFETRGRECATPDQAEGIQQQSSSLACSHVHEYVRSKRRRQQFARAN